MGTAALLRAGRSHRQLPLSNVKTEVPGTPYARGAGHLRMSVMEASAATRSAPRLHSRFSGALGLSAL